MSSPGAAPTPDNKDAKEGHRKSLGKYVKRMSSVFKREKPSKPTAASETTASASTAPTVPAMAEPNKEAAPVNESDQETAPAPVIEPVPIHVDAAAPENADATKVSGLVVQEIPRSVLQQERARALFAKYGLTLESHEWVAASALPVNVQRIEKPIRMRVHRTCHRCGTTYNADRVCVKCEHKRCKKCPRFPKKKNHAEKPQPQTKEAAVPKALPKKKRVLTIAPRTGGEVAYQPAKQRVRRNCHKCQSLFIPPTATICESCRHIRCTKCPREPAKLNKWPNGYPGDAECDSDTEMDRETEKSKRIWRKPRTRVRWECEQCNGTFLDGSLQCPGCKHEKCDKCVRRPLKRVKPQRTFSPDVVKSVEEKLKALKMHDEASPTEVEAT